MSSLGMIEEEGFQIENNNKKFIEYQRSELTNKNQV